MQTVMIPKNFRKKMDAIRMNQKVTVKMGHCIHRLSEKNNFRTATDF